MTDVNEQTVTNDESANQDLASNVPQAVPRIEEIDRMALELAKSQRFLANAEAKTALANSEKAELSYKYVVLQLYMKYGLTAADALKESGEIVFGGALNSAQTK